MKKHQVSLSLLSLFSVCVANANQFAIQDAMSVIRQHPEVIADFGGLNAQPYYKDITLGNATPEPMTETERKNYSAESHNFPLSSSHWHSGFQKVQSHNYPTEQAFFIIGDDERSVRWLRANADRLTNANAFGFVVKAKSNQSLTQLRAIHPALTLLPYEDENGDFANQLNTQSFPILVVPRFLGTNIDDVRQALINAAGNQ